MGKAQLGLPAWGSEETSIAEVNLYKGDPNSARTIIVSVDIPKENMTLEFVAIVDVLKTSDELNESNNVLESKFDPYKASTSTNVPYSTTIPKGHSTRSRTAEKGSPENQAKRAPDGDGAAEAAASPPQLQVVPIPASRARRSSGRV